MTGRDSRPDAGRSRSPVPHGVPPPRLDYRPPDSRKPLPFAAWASIGFASAVSLLGILAAVLRAGWVSGIGAVVLCFVSIAVLLVFAFVVEEARPWNGFGLGVALGFALSCLVGAGVVLALAPFGPLR